MARMALAAQLGGAVGIRANTVADILAIRKLVDLPVIGIIKKEYEDSSVYITPTMTEVDALAEIHTDIIALDATKRVRPQKLELNDFFHKIRKKYPDQLFMADCSTYEEGLEAAQMGFDLVGTTMSGYTSYTKGTKVPNLYMVERLARNLIQPVIAEGGITTPEELADRKSVV